MNISLAGVTNKIDKEKNDKISHIACIELIVNYAVISMLYFEVLYILYIYIVNLISIYFNTYMI